MEVTLIDKMGTELTIVNAARVSFGKHKTILDKSDEGLIRYLAKHEHFSPFRHCMIQLHIKCPEFVARQMYKHVVGIEATSSNPTKDHAWSEISGRYVKMGNDMYIPKSWRGIEITTVIPGPSPAINIASLSNNNNAELSSSIGIANSMAFSTVVTRVTNKQGSGDDLTSDKQDQANTIYNNALTAMTEAYESLLELGVCKEQARIILPMSFYTEFYWTASLQAMINFIHLRDASDAQKEIRDLAQQIRSIVEKLFPIACTALLS